MLTILQASILGAFQGVAELFPISSLGHSIVFPALVGWNINEHSTFFLAFLIATHFATALVLFIFFWKDWKRILMGIGRFARHRRIAPDDTSAKLGLLLIIGTVPAGLLGLLFEKQIRLVLIAPAITAFFIAMNGLLLFAAERLRKRAALRKTAANIDAHIARLSWKQAFAVGTMQALALIPGFSRTGASLAGGLWVGLSREDALRFSLLLATPIIGAAALLKLPELVLHGTTDMLSVAAVGAAAAAITSYISARLFTRYVHTKTNTLTPFAIYCIIAGAFAFYFLI